MIPKPAKPTGAIDIMIIAVIITLVVITGCLAGCAAPVPVPTAEIPVAIPIDCKAPSAGPKPDVTDLAALTRTDTPQRVITVMGAALKSLAEDDARLRALMGK